MLIDIFGNDLPDPSNVDEMFEARFLRPGCGVRSPEYKAGFKRGLMRQVDKTYLQPGFERDLKCPFSVGSCQFDAWFSGDDHGRLYQTYCADRFADESLREISK